MKTLKKRALMLLALAVVMSANLSAQISKNIMDTTKQWNVGFIYPLGINTAVYKFGDDTLYDGKIYKRLLESIWSIDNYKDANILLREENGKVYFINLNVSPFVTEEEKQTLLHTEYMLYDFNLQLGDSITISFFGDAYHSSYDWLFRDSARVTNIDTVRIEKDLLKRITLESQKDGQIIEWIEGMGAISGLIQFACVQADGATPELLCFSQNGDIMYQSDKAQKYNSCFIDVGIEDVEELDGKIYPNPTIDVITIDVSVPTQIYIVDIVGNTIYKDTVYSMTSVDISTFNPGMYVIFLTNAINKRNYKFIKK